MAPAQEAERQPRPQASFRPDQDGPGARLRRSVLRLMADERPGVALARDLVLVLGFLLLILGSLWIYTGQSFPGTSPVVVVESGSMMHPDGPYGHVGTIDPGDLVLVKAVHGADDVATAFGPGDRTGYGGQGDVIIYRPFGDLAATPIIHRAMTWVEATPHSIDPQTGQETFRYSFYDERGVLQEDQASVTLLTLGISNMRPTSSGFVTKGDNPLTNPRADQVSHYPGAFIEPSWVVGKARGEIPWLGLVKLGMTGNERPTEFPEERQCQVLKAWAPCDMWVMLGAAFAVVLGVPFVLDRATRRSERLRRWLT